jgi:hypothetical protein
MLRIGLMPIRDWGALKFLMGSKYWLPPEFIDRANCKFRIIIWIF